MAIHTVTPASLSPQPSIITSKQISRYAELAALVSQLDAQQKTLRAELLALRGAGAEQETTSPYLLAFIDQSRRTVDWKTHALDLAELTQVRVKPNPAFAAGLCKPTATVRIPLNLDGSQAAIASGD